MNIMDSFFNLGSKITKNDPLLKAKYDYTFYWIIFLAFIFIAGEMWYNFIFKHAPLSSLMWAVIITLFCWFNYQGLCGFRAIYVNLFEMKKRMGNQEEEPLEDIDEMLNEFGCKDEK